MDKRGISAIVATVLIVLITIAGVAILWAVLWPLINLDSSFDHVSAQILVSEGYTVFDPDANVALVQIERGTDSVNISALQIVFDINGSSYVYRAPKVPEVNGKKTYYFNFVADKIEGVPQSVSVAAVIQRGKQEKVSDVLDKKKIPIQKANLDESFMAGRGENYLVEDDDDILDVCNDLDNDGRGTGNDCTGPLDCNDDDPLIGPDAIERCENCVDDDCDGNMDLSDSDCQFSFMSNVVSHWDFDQNIEDSKSRTELHFYELKNYAPDDSLIRIYGSPENVSYVQGITCKGEALDFGQGNYLTSNEYTHIKEGSTYRVSTNWTASVCQDNGLKSNSGTVAVWFKREGYSKCVRQIYNSSTGVWSCVLPSHDYIFSMYNWSATGNLIMSRLYIDFKYNTDLLEVGVGGSPYDNGHVGWNTIGPVPLNEWHFAVLTWQESTPGADEGRYKFYLDGESKGEFIYDNFFPTAQVHFGAWADNPGCDSPAWSFENDVPDTYTEYFDGVIDEARLFDRALTVDEVKALYDSYDPRDYE
jgi:hypothetical protein